MPQAFVKKIASKHHVSISTAEKKWEKAKKLAKDQGQENNYAYITGIFKHLMGENVNDEQIVLYIRNKFNDYVQKHGSEWVAVNLNKIKKQLIRNIANDLKIDIKQAEYYLEKIINETFEFPKFTLKRFLTLL